MTILFEALKAALIGLVEGVTEWLPISSTGHMIIVDEFVKLEVSQDFLNLFLVVIQIGAIMAVIILYFHKLNPFSRRKTKVQRSNTWRLWGMVVVGCIPAAIVGILLDDWVNEHFYNAVVVATMLIVYGVIFIVLEHHNRNKAARAAQQMGQGQPAGKHVRDPKTGQLATSRYLTQEDVEDSIFKITDVMDIDIKTALKIGLFQVLAIIPGTSRSGATIIGGMLCGTSRSAAAEFTFFLAIPVMLGWGAVKVAKFIMGGLVMTQTEIVVLVVGIVVAFVVSILSIKFLMGYIKKHDFAVFGWYRIIVGVALLIFFGVTGQLFIMQ